METIDRYGTEEEIRALLAEAGESGIDTDNKDTARTLYKGYDEYGYGPAAEYGYGPASSYYY